MTVMGVSQSEAPPVAEPDPALWPRAAARLRAELGDDAYDAWFGRIIFEGIKGTVVHVSLPTPFLVKRVHARYADQFLAACQSLWPTVTGVRVRCRGVSNLRGIAPALPALVAPLEPPSSRFMLRLVRICGKTARGIWVYGKGYGTHRLWDQYSGTVTARYTMRYNLRLPPDSMLCRVACDEVTRYYHLYPGSLLSMRRDMQTADARRVAMYVIKELSGKSLGQIGEWFRRDRSTVVSAIDKVGKRMLAEPGFAKELAELTELVKKHRA